MSLPAEQTKSSGTQSSTVFGRYSDPMVIAGWLMTPMNRSDGVPSRATAATWLATAGGITCGTLGSVTPSGITSEVTNPMTAAPCEYPPSTIDVFGHELAVF